MSQPLFVTGMMRSGTTLAQMLLDGHPDVMVAYQPFHRFLVDVKQRFLDDSGIASDLPLDEGDPAHGQRRAAFTAWLATRRFSQHEAASLFRQATAGKGGGYPGLALPEAPADQDFFALHELLLAALHGDGGDALPLYVGHKEILCEEFVPAFVDAGIRCVLVLRDPRAATLSAAHGRYRDMVGDRYPIMMMIRLWRKTAAYWLRYRDDPRVLCLRYEDAASDPGRELAKALAWLGVPSLPEPACDAALLRDGRGRPWRGNSSFGDKAGVDASSIGRWREVMADADARFVAACCRHEMLAAGYEVPDDLDIADIAGFEEPLAGVRPAYHAKHGLDDLVRRNEMARFAMRPGTAEGGNSARTHFLFPDAMTPPPSSRGART